MIDWDSWIKNRVDYLRCIGGLGVWKTFPILHKMPHYFLIYYKISFREGRGNLRDLYYINVLNNNNDDNNLAKITIKSSYL